METGALDRNQLVGHWREADSTDPVDIIFRADGTYSGSATREGEWHFAGTWTLIQRALQYECTESSWRIVPPGSKDRDTIIAIAKDYYVVESMPGRRIKYVRVN